MKGEYDEPIDFKIRKEKKSNASLFFLTKFRKLPDSSMCVGDQADF